MTEQLEKTPKSQQPARRRLGRGLNALLGNQAEVEPTDSSVRQDENGSMRQIAVDSIERNPFQPRKEFGDASLQELAASIEQHGLLQPLLVRRRGGNFQLIAGERRWLAARQAGLKTVPCHIIERDDRGSTEAAIEENLKRKDLNPLEKAMAFQDYRDRFGCSIEELAKTLSMQRSTVSNFLRLLELPDAVKEALSQDRISNGHARALLSVTQAEHRIELCRRIERESLSVRATEAEVRKLLKSKGTIPFPKKDEHSAAPQLTSHLRSLQEQLRQQLGVKVEIRPSGKERGKIVIHFQSNDDFERILRQLRRAA